MCYFCGGFWPVSELTSMLTGLEMGTWMYGNDLGDIREVYLDIYENKPIMSRYGRNQNSEVYEWFIAQHGECREMIRKYVFEVTDFYDTFDRCRAHAKFDNMTEAAQMQDAAKFLVPTTVLLWKPIQIRI
jgi:hypothetical protein